MSTIGGLRNEPERVTNAIVRAMSVRSGPVTVFVPTWNAGPRLDEVLEAVRRQRTTREVRLRATDSGSTDGTLEILARHGVEVRRIAQREFNHGRTRNEAVLAADTEFVALLTQDARPADEHWLEALLTPFEDPRVAGTWARQIPRAACHPFQRANLATHVGAAEATRVVEPLTIAQWNALTPQERVARLGFDDVSSCVRRSAVERTPIPTVDFAEDMAWARAALLAGWRLVFAANARVEHSHDLTSREISERVELTHAARRRFADFDPLPNLGDLLRATRQTSRFFLRAALRTPELDLATRIAALLQAAPFAYLQSASTRRGARSTEYEPPR